MILTGIPTMTSRFLTFPFPSRIVSTSLSLPSVCTPAQGRSLLSRAANSFCCICGAHFCSAAPFLPPPASLWHCLWHGRDRAHKTGSLLRVSRFLLLLVHNQVSPPLLGSFHLRFQKPGQTLAKDRLPRGNGSWSGRAANASANNGKAKRNAYCSCVPWPGEGLLQIYVCCCHPSVPVFPFPGS